MTEILIKHLTSQSGDANIPKLFWVSTAFIIGAIFFGLLSTAFSGLISQWYTGAVGSWFGRDLGNFVTG